MVVDLSQCQRELVCFNDAVGIIQIAAGDTDIVCIALALMIADSRTRPCNISDTVAQAHPVVGLMDGRDTQRATACMCDTSGVVGQRSQRENEISCIVFDNTTVVIQGIYNGPGDVTPTCTHKK